jgi:hypothetical protein
LLSIAAFDDDPGCPSIESKGLTLLVVVAVVAMLRAASTKDNNCVRLLTGNFVTITVRGNDTLPELVTLVPAV